jgi:cell fate (sporulation/competence/biofilm development) regulator YlbF (YheA/YmcA/DUF963 family)
LNPKPPLFSSLTPEQLNNLTKRIPDYLKTITSEELSEIETDQENLRKRYSQSFSKLSHDEVSLQYALGYEKMAREFFEAVNNGYEPAAEELGLNRRRLAQSLQSQGRYQEAIYALSSPGPDQLEASLLAELEAEKEAIARPDDEHCECEIAGDLPGHFIVKYVRVKGEPVPLVKCVTCPYLNATKQLPEKLARLEQERGKKR